MPLPPYLKSPEFRTSPEDYRTELRQRVLNLMARDVPIVLSLGHLAHLSQTRYARLRSIVERKRAREYKVFSIKKRSGGKRWICVPRDDLARAQTWIQQEILSSSGALALLSSHSRAFASGDSIARNARDHCGAGQLIKIDLSDFFDTIDETRVFAVFRQLGYPKLLSFELARLCTRIVVRPRSDTPPPPYARRRWIGTGPGSPYPTGQLGHLPQGAPTSPMLANLVSAVMDKRLGAIAATYDAAYTRYADDIAFSIESNDRKAATELLRKAMLEVCRQGFSVNTRKISITPASARKIVTGLVVNGDTPSIPREMVSRIEVPLHYIKKYGLLEHCARSSIENPIRYFRHLEGLVMFAAGVCPQRGTRWREALRDAREANSDVFEAMQIFGV